MKKAEIHVGDELCYYAGKYPFRVRVLEVKDYRAVKVEVVGPIEVHGQNLIETWAEHVARMDEESAQAVVFP